MADQENRGKGRAWGPILRKEQGTVAVHMGRRRRVEQRQHARALRGEGRTWADIAGRLRAVWPELNARAAMRIAHDWNQGQAAQAWSRLWPENPKSEKDIGLWEIRRPGFTTLDRIARIYECSIADLVTDLGDYRHLDPANMPGVSAGRYATHEDDDVERRDFLGGAIAVGASAVASRAVPGLATGLPVTGDLARLHSAVERATRLERASQYVAVNAVLPGILSNAEDMADGADGPSCDESADVLSQAHALRAWVLVKEDRPLEAEAAARGALGSAQRSGDHVLVGAALRCLGETYMRAGKYTLAADLAVEAAEVVQRAQDTSYDALAVQGAGYLSAATSCARAQDSPGATELLEAAEACARHLGRDVAGAAVFGPSNVAIHCVAVSIELGDPLAALRWAERLDFAVPPGLDERSARYLIDIARAWTVIRNDAEAVQTLLRAEAIAPEEVCTHRLTRAVLAQLLPREHRTRTPELRSLARRCRALDLP